MTDNYSLSDIAAVTDGNRNNGMFGNDSWAWIVILLLFGYGRGFGGFGGGFGGGSCGTPCATQADVRAAVDQQTLISKLDQQTYGLADSTYALNNTINGNFRTLDGAICNLGYQALQNTNAIQTQLADCCCGIKGEIKDVAYGNERNSWNISKQISDCCCETEKMNMQNRFDAQAYNCNTLQAIDKLGDRIDNRLDAMENARVREQLDAERTKNAVLQGQIDRAQLRYDIVNDVRPCPHPAYITCNPYAYTNPCNTGCGCGSF